MVKILLKICKTIEKRKLSPNKKGIPENRQGIRKQKRGAP
jgi:hypothetical protein